VFARIGSICLLLACTARNPAYIPRATDAYDEEMQAIPMQGGDAGRPNGSGNGSGSDGAATSTAAPSRDGGAGGLASGTGGLVAHWRLDQGSGSAAPDTTGANSGALRNGAAWSAMVVPGNQFGDLGSAQLDGVDDAVELGTATLPTLEHAKSISVWFWIGGAPSTTRQNIFVLANELSKRSVQLGFESYKIAVWGWNVPVGGGIIYGPTLSMPGWYHLGYTFDGHTHTLYLRGSVVGSSTGDLGTAVITDAVIGAYDPDLDIGERFKGLVNDVRVYDRALSAKEISDLAAGGP
jgi:hypothetical protein